MIDYQTFCQLRQLYDEKGLKISQIAAELQLDLKTVEKWVDQPTYHPRQGTRRASKLDSFKGQIAALLERHPTPPSNSSSNCVNGATPVATPFLRSLSARFVLPASPPF